MPFDLHDNPFFCVCVSPRGPQMSEAILITLDVALSALLKREKRGCLNVSTQPFPWLGLHSSSQSQWALSRMLCWILKGSVGCDNQDCLGQVTYSVRQVKISVACLTGQVAISFYFGKIQGDSRKFLEHFKLFWVKNIITFIKCLPITAKIRNKRWFFSYIFVFVSLSRRMLPFDIWPNFPVTTWTLP